MTKVSVLDVINALDRWERCVVKDTRESFNKYLGVDDFPQYYTAIDDRWFLPDEAERRLKLLLSLHYETIIKTHLIKHPWK